MSYRFVKNFSCQSRMKFQTFGLVILLHILSEFVQLRDAYKSIRPYKYYQPRLRSRNKLPSYSLHGRPRYRNFKKGPPLKHSYNRYQRGLPIETWHEPLYSGNHVGKEPYTIEIELPKQRHAASPWINDRNLRNYDTGTMEDFYSDEDYSEDDEEFEERVMQTGGKRVRVTVVKGMKPKLRIKISRDDHFDDIADSPSTMSKPDRQQNSSMIFNEFGETGEENWIIGNHAPSFPEALRGA